VELGLTVSEEQDLRKNQWFARRIVERRILGKCLWFRDCIDQDRSGSHRCAVVAQLRNRKEFPYSLI
jgi:hypothetical protein